MSGTYPEQSGAYDAQHAALTDAAKNRPDLRTLLMEPWDPTGSPYAPEHRPPLATRDPDFLPPGLECRVDNCFGEKPVAPWWYLNGRHITDAQAEDMVLGRAVKRGYVIEPPLHEGDTWRASVDKGDIGGRPPFADAPTAIEALIACGHRVADEKATEANP